MTGARKQVNVVFPYKVYRDLLKYSKVRDLTVSPIVREAVIEYLERKGLGTNFVGEEK